MTDDDKTITLRFEDVSVAEAGKKVAALREDLLDASTDISAEIRKEDSSTQDFGTTLVLVLGAPAVVAVAKGIADFLRRNRGKLLIEISGKKLVFEGSSTDAARIVEAFSGKKE